MGRISSRRHAWRRWRNRNVTEKPPQTQERLAAKRPCQCSSCGLRALSCRFKVHLQAFAITQPGHNNRSDADNLLPCGANVGERAPPVKPRRNTENFQHRQSLYTSAARRARGRKAHGERLKAERTTQKARAISKHSYTRCRRGEAPPCESAYFRCPGFPLNIDEYSRRPRVPGQLFGDTTVPLR